MTSHCHLEPFVFATKAVTEAIMALKAFPHILDPTTGAFVLAYGMKNASYSQMPTLYYHDFPQMELDLCKKKSPLLLQR